MGAGAATMYISDTRVRDLEDVLTKARGNNISFNIIFNNVTLR